MRILYVVNDALIGGAQTLIEALARAAGPTDSVHLLVLLGEDALSDRYEEAAETVTYVRMNRRSVVPLRAIRTLSRLVKDLRIDVVHSHLQQSDLINILTPHGRPRVSTVHASINLSTNRLAGAVWRAVAILSGRFDSVVACTDSARELALHLKYRYPPSKMPVVPNGTMTARSPAPVPSGMNLLHPARFTPSKDHSTLFRAFARIAPRFPEAQLRCAGQGVDDDNTALTELLDELGIRQKVALLGPINSVRDEIRAARAVVFSSWNEALPMAGLEAVSEGVPFLTTDAGNCPDLAVASEAVVPVRDAEALSGAMAWLLELPSAEQQHLRRLSWQLAVDNYDVRRTFERYREIYRDLGVNA